MKLVFHVTLVFFVASFSAVWSDDDIESTHDLKSEASRQKIYDIISSHEDRKYGDHGGHEYEEGEVPRKSSSRKYKRYGYQPDDGNYYYVQQPQQPSVSYIPKAPIAQDVYVVPQEKAVYPQPKDHYPQPKDHYPQPKDHYPQPKDNYPQPKDHYPVVETAYVEPKKGYLSHDKVYVTPKRPEAVYVVPKTPKEHLYADNDGAYIEDKTAPITIGKTARTVYPRHPSHSHYPVVDAKAPSEYVVLEGQKPPRPLILDPKLKETYHLQQPVAHYSAPEHQVVVKPKVSVPVHYAAPVKDYEHYDSHHGSEDKGHHASGHKYYNDNTLKKESGHKSHGHHEVAGHKAHSSVSGHHDQHDRHHNRGLYERDRGYHYEKAYAYDRVRAHHDIGSDRGAHSSYGAHQGHEAHKDAGHHGGETYSYFKKDDHGAGYGYHDGNSLYKKGHGYYGQKYFPTYYHG